MKDHHKDMVLEHCRWFAHVVMTRGENWLLRDYARRIYNLIEGLKDISREKGRQLRDELEMLKRKVQVMDHNLHLLELQHPTFQGRKKRGETSGN